MKTAPPRKSIAVPIAAARPAEVWRALRQALSEMVRFDPGGFSPLAGARVALGVVAALVGGEPAEAAMAVGALLAGGPGAVTVGRISLRAMVAVTLVMALSVFVGSASGELGWLTPVCSSPGAWPAACWCPSAALPLRLASRASSP
jgi:hypothetical protein